MSDVFDKISDRNELDRLRRERAEEEWRSAVDRVIDEAQKKGKFDNLPGQGKPLKRRKNPHAGDRALAYELLQNNDYTLPWIEKRNEMLAKIDAMRAELGQEWRYYQAQLPTAAGVTEHTALRDEWQAYVRQMEARIVRLNKKITHLNLTIPAEKLEILKLNLDKELQRIGAQR